MASLSRQVQDINTRAQKVTINMHYAPYQLSIPAQCGGKEKRKKNTLMLFVSRVLMNVNNISDFSSVPNSVLFANQCTEDTKVIFQQFHKKI